MKSLKFFLSVLTTVLSICVISSCQKKEVNKGEKELQKVAFVLDWTPNTNHTGVYVAIEKGFFEEVGLEVSIIQPPEDGAISAVATNQAQFGVGFQEFLMLALATENPPPVKAVAAIIEHNTSGLISLKEKNIDSFSKLEEKKYATWGMDIEQEILKEAVESSGGDFSKVELVPHSGADAISLLSSGVDAVWVYEGWDVIKAKIENVDYNYISFESSNPILDYYTPVIISNNDLLDKEPEMVKNFLTAVSKGYEYAISNPEESAEILLKAVPELDDKLVKESQLFLSKQYKAEQDKWGKIDNKRWSEFNNWIYEKGMISKDIGLEGFTNDFLPE